MSRIKIVSSQFHLSHPKYLIFSLWAKWVWIFLCERNSRGRACFPWCKERRKLICSICLAWRAWCPRWWRPRCVPLGLRAWQSWLQIVCPCIWQSINLRCSFRKWINSSKQALVWLHRLAWLCGISWGRCQPHFSMWKWLLMLLLVGGTPRGDSIDLSSCRLTWK